MQIWRFVTGLLWYQVSFHWLILLFYLYSYSRRLETGGCGYRGVFPVRTLPWHPAGYFSGSPADYVFMLIFNAVCINIIGIFLGIPVLSSALVFSTLYVWCQINKETIVQFWFGIQLKVNAHTITTGHDWSIFVCVFLRAHNLNLEWPFFQNKNIHSVALSKVFLMTCFVRQNLLAQNPLILKKPQGYNYSLAGFFKNELFWQLSLMAYNLSLEWPFSKLKRAFCSS